MNERIGVIDYVLGEIGSIVNIINKARFEDIIREKPIALNLYSVYQDLNQATCDVSQVCIEKMIRY